MDIAQISKQYPLPEGFYWDTYEPFVGIRERNNAAGHDWWHFHWIRSNDSSGSDWVGFVVAQKNPDTRGVYVSRFDWEDVEGAAALMHAKFLLGVYE